MVAYVSILIKLRTLSDFIMEVLVHAREVFLTGMQMINTGCIHHRSPSHLPDVVNH